MSRFVAAIDQGTTSTRCILFNRNGAIVGLAQKEHRQIYPQPGWVEHDPLEIWQRTEEVIAEALSEARAGSGDVVAIGVTNQRETTLVWNPNTGQPYYNAIVWQDTRTRAICDKLSSDGGQDRFRKKTGLPLATYFSGPKLQWMLENIEGLRSAAESGEAVFGNVDTWLIWNLTGGPSGGTLVTDVTNASRTLLMDLETLTWDEEILGILGIPRKMLPEIVPSSDPDTWGSTMKDGPFQESIPVCGDLGDQQAALVGQACFDTGSVKNTYGTGCFTLLNTGIELVPSKSGLITTVGYRLGSQPAVYALEGSIAVAGALVQWLRDNLGIIGKSSEVEELARSVDDNGGIYFVPAFSGLFAPYWRSDARGVIAGMTRYVNKGHIARAALEATAFQVSEVLDAMRADSGVEIESLKVDGGMVYNETLMSFQADILGIPVIRPKVSETTSLGAAYAAGLAAGFWEDMEELSVNWQAGKTWEPKMDSEKRQELYRGWKKAVERTFGWLD